LLQEKLYKHDFGVVCSRHYYHQGWYAAGENITYC